MILRYHVRTMEKGGKNPSISGGVAHEVPADVRRTLASSTELRTTWNSLTPLARNEWICWVISVKKQETRREHLARLKEDLLKGKRRPCCWMGCVHRTDKPMSPSQRYVLRTRTKKT